jgi:ABC-type transport system involved in cytochrome bd biosynthesis fused ATPase/permease subunit
MSSSHAVSPRNQESVADLLRRLMGELSTLFRQELSLATAEISDAMTRLSRGVISVASGGAVLYAGFLTLLAAAVLALALVVQAWLAALIVGGVVTLIGLVLVLKGKKALEPSQLKPRRTVESLRQDKDVLMRKES